MATSDLETRARQGDPAAFGELIRDWDRDLRGVTWSVVGDAATTDEVMERSYIAAFDNIDRFDGKASLQRWLKTVCLRAAIEHTRTASPVVPGAVDADAVGQIDASDRELDNAFRSLDGVERLLLMLTAGLGHDFDTTASIVGMPSATVASQVGRARDRLHARSDHDAATGDALDDQRLHDYLQARIPDPGVTYWPSIETRLAGEPPATPPEPTTELAASGLAASGLAEPEVIAAQLPEPESAAPGANTGPDDTRRNLLIAAAIIALVGIGLFVFLSRSDDPADVASQAAIETDSAPSTSEATSDTGEAVASDPGSDDAAAEPATDDDLAGPDEDAGSRQAESSPLQAIVGRLGGEADTTAGPYCFTHPASYVFPADELEDRRALLRLDVAADGFVTFTAMQGETIVISGSGYPDINGTLLTTPVAEVGASGAPPYEIQIGDNEIRVAATEPALELVDCLVPDISSRVDTMFRLLADPTAGWQFDAWPPDDAVLSSAGLGPIRIGMTVSELAAELGSDLDIETIDGNIAGACGWVATTTAIARDVWILVELTGPDDAIIRRVSTFAGPWFTPSGITVGSTQQDVIETFPGQIEERPHVYTDGTYMRFLPSNADDPNTVEFVNEGGVIAEIRAGDRDWVGLIEGCA